MSYFDHFAKSSSTKIGNFLYDKKIKKEYKLISAFLKNKNAEILEIGPGKGKLAKTFLKNNFRKYDIIEPNAIMRNNLIKNGIRHAKNYLVPPLREKKHSYNLIILSDVFEHLNDTKEAKTLIDNIYNSLKKEGVIVLISPDIMDWQIDFWGCDYTHSNPTSLRRAIQIFENYDIKTISHHYFYSCFSGILGFIIGKIVRLLTAPAKLISYKSKFYKLRLTFLRRFIVVGKK